MILIHVCKINGLGAAEWDLIETSTMSVLFTAYLLDKKCQLRSALFLLLIKSREGTSINTAGKKLDPVVLCGYHPALKLSGIPTLTLIVSLTYGMDNI